jgi:C4-dicarboxylate-specific signal transduction histidine kinase
VRDITESKQREKELNLYREKIVRTEQLASMEALSATVVHELTQPLIVIRLSIESALAKLKATSSSGAATKKLNTCLTEISNTTSIVERFHHYARKSIERTVKEVDLKAVAERTVKLLNGNARRARVTLRLKGPDGLLSLYFNEKYLEQLFFSLVQNVIQAADGKKSRRLIISGTVKNKHVELKFSDDCSGIIPENMGRIFEPFFTTKAVGEGTGLGLSIMEHIVSQAGGKVCIERKRGKSTTFFVTLPINKRGWFH